MTARSAISLPHEESIMEFDFDNLKKMRKDLVSHRSYPYAISVFRGLLSYAVFALMQAIVLPRFRAAFYSTVEDIVKWETAIMLVCELLLTLLMLNTVLGAFAVYDRRDREDFLTRHPVEYSKEEERHLLLRSKLFWTELGAFASCLLLFGVSIEYRTMFKAFSIGLPSYLPRILLTVFFLSALVGLKLFSAIDARNYWHELPRKLMKKSLAVSLEKKKKGTYSYWRMALRLVFSTVLYYVAGMIITYVIVACASMAIGTFVLLIFTPSVFAIFLIIVAFFYLRTIRARIKLIRKLKKICEDRNFELLELKRPYRSIFRDAYNDYNIAVKVGERTFYCRLIACVNRGNKYTFNTDDGTLVRARMIHIPKPPRAVGVRGFVQTADYGNGDDLEIFGFVSEIDYTFEADGEKVLLLNPVPRRVRKQSGTLIGEMDNGDRVGEYRIYTGNAFLRYIDRLGMDTRGRIFHDD